MTTLSLLQPKILILRLFRSGIEDYNNANGNGFTVAESVFTVRGAKLGYSQMDGKIQAASNTLVTDVHVNLNLHRSATFTLKKEVRKAGASGCRLQM